MLDRYVRKVWTSAGISIYVFEFSILTTFHQSIQWTLFKDLYKINE